MKDILGTVTKLLRAAELNKVTSPEEAANAMARAQRLIDENNLSEALLAYDGQQTEPDEPIVDFYAKGAPLDDASPNKLVRWKAALATTIAVHNGCRVWVSGGVFHLVGRPRDADTTRYMYALVAGETERLVKREGQGCGRTWKNNYRLGVVDTIVRRLAASRRQFEEEQRQAAGSTSTALVRINSALMVTNRKGAEADDFMFSSNMKVKLSRRKAPLSQGRQINEARQAGRAAGEKINLDNNARGALGSGQKALTS